MAEPIALDVLNGNGIFCFGLGENCTWRPRPFVVLANLSGAAATALLLASQFEVGLLSPLELRWELEFPCQVVISRLAKLGAGGI